MIKSLHILTLTLLLAISGYAQESKITREFFGIDFWAYDPGLWQEFFEVLDEDSVQLGLVGFNIGWEMIEPNPPVQGVHQYNWSQLDELMQLGVASDRVFDINVLIRNNWATIVPVSDMDEICCDMAPLKEDAESDVAQWGMTAYEAYDDFIRNLVERYDSDGVDDAPDITNAAIKYLQLGDEPEATSHFIEYGGTPENYNQMLATMYGAAKSADTTILVVRGKSNPGSIFDDNPDEATLLARRATYFDFISTSLQLGKDNFDLFAINFNDHYTGLFPFTNWLQAEMTKNGYSKPIMVGDARTTAWSRSDDGNSIILPKRYPAGFAESITNVSHPQHGANLKLYHADEVRQSLRKILTALASGQQAISLQPAWGPEIHERMFWQDAGLLNSRIMVATQSMNGARKPVFYAAKQLIDELLGADLPIEILDLGANVYAYKMSRKGKDIFLLWHEKQFEVDNQGLVQRNQTLTVDLTSFVTTSQVRVKQFVTELNTEGVPIYPEDKVIPANNIAIDETPVLVEAALTTSIKDAGSSQIELGLKQNYPNPFRTNTTIEYQLAQSNLVLLRIFDIQGQELHVLVDEEQPVGDYSVVWDGKNSLGNAVPDGIYLLQMSAGDFVQTKRLLLLN